MAKQDFSYKIVHPYKEKINSRKDFLDIEVKFKGRAYRGSITTTLFINEKLGEYAQTEENGDGSYFCARGMLILKDLNSQTIRRTLADLIRRGDLEQFLES